MTQSDTLSDDTKNKRSYDTEGQTLWHILMTQVSTYSYDTDGHTFYDRWTCVLMTHTDTLSNDKICSYDTERCTFLPHRWTRSYDTDRWHRGTNIYMTCLWQRCSYDTAWHAFLYYDRWTRILMAQMDTRSYDSWTHFLMTQMFLWHRETHVLVAQLDTCSYDTDEHVFLWHRGACVLMTLMY